MISSNLVLPLLILVVAFMALPLLLQFSIKLKTKGRHLCAIISKGKPLTIKLLKFNKDDFVRDGEDEWVLNAKYMKPIEYPIGWPLILSGFQQTLWCSLVMRGRADPLDWEDPPAGILSSKELPAVMDPRWLINLVKGVGEEGKFGKTEKMLAILTVAVSFISIVMVAYVISRLSTIEQAIRALRAVIR